MKDELYPETTGVTYTSMVRLNGVYPEAIGIASSTIVAFDLTNLPGTGVKAVRTTQEAQEQITEYLQSEKQYGTKEARTRAKTGKEGIAIPKSLPRRFDFSE